MLHYSFDDIFIVILTLFLSLSDFRKTLYSLNTSLICSLKITFHTVIALKLHNSRVHRARVPRERVKSRLCDCDLIAALIRRLKLPQGELTYNAVAFKIVCRRMFYEKPCSLGEDKRIKVRLFAQVVTTRPSVVFAINRLIGYLWWRKIEGHK